MDQALNSMATQPNQILTLYVDDKPFALSVDEIQDVLVTPKITNVPLSGEAVIGLLNLRGRIVTALDLGFLLGLRPTVTQESNMSIIMESQGDLFSIVVDRVGEVLDFQKENFNKSPSNLDEKWRNLSNGIYNQKDNLFILLNEEKLCQSSFSS